MSNGKSMFEQMGRASMGDGEPRRFARLGGRRAGKMMANVTRALSTDQGRAIEAGCAVLVKAGVALADIEVVHETFSKPNGRETIHTRAFVRRRAK